MNNSFFLQSIINIDELIQQNIRDKKQMKILYEIITDYLDTQIQKTRKEVNKINDNYNILYAKQERQQISCLLDKIDALNRLKYEVNKIFTAISLYE